MDSEISGTVLSVTPRIVGNNKTIYDVALDDGNTYATFDATIYAKAQSLVGRPATARVRVGPSKKNPQYTDYFINDIAPQGQLAATSAPVATASSLPLAPAISPASRGGGGMSPEREQKIVKQSSFSTAFNFIGALYQGAGESEFEEATGKALDLAKELYAKVMGESPVPEPVAVEAPVAASAATNGQGDGIPW